MPRVLADTVSAVWILQKYLKKQGRQDSRPFFGYSQPVYNTFISSNKLPREMGNSQLGVFCE